PGAGLVACDQVRAAAAGADLLEEHPLPISRPLLAATARARARERARERRLAALPRRRDRRIEDDDGRERRVVLARGQRPVLPLDADAEPSWHARQLLDHDLGDAV